MTIHDNLLAREKRMAGKRVPVECKCGFKTSLHKYSYKKWVKLEIKQWLCYECIKKEQDEIKQATINLHRRRQACNGAARKQWGKARLKGIK